MLNDFLSSHKLFAFEHRIFFRLLTFTNKIVNNIFSPSILKDCLTPRAQRHNTRSLRNSNEFDTPRNKTQFGEMTFSHFFPNLVNLACLSLIHLPIQQFRSNILKDINLIFNKLSVETDRQTEKYNIFKKFFYKKSFLLDTIYLKILYFIFFIYFYFYLNYFIISFLFKTISASLMTEMHW